MEKKTKESTKERDDLKKHNLSLRERLKCLRSEIKTILDATSKNGIRTEVVVPIPELPAPTPSQNAASPANNIAPVSVATQTMPLIKKGKAEAGQNSEDEEVNVDEVTES